MTRARDDWWRSAVVYQVYPRSFADSDGDGLGDVPGVISRLDYLADLGIDAIWISPLYVSPLNDGGYDVADYTDVDPRLGTLDDIDVLVREAHARGLRILLDLVPNHTSAEHPWFVELLGSAPGSPAWNRYVVREGTGPDRSLPPNNWQSVFHGPGWSPLPGPDGKPSGYWYLHLFDSTQPDLNWDSPDVRAEFAGILRFWFDRGIDGFRIDVAHGLVKERGLPDFDYSLVGDGPVWMALDGISVPFWDQDGVHDIYREWRRIADEYDPPRIYCGETWVGSAERLASYQRPDELHTSFNFAYLQAGWDAAEIVRTIDETVASHALVDAPPTWVLSNHDVVRHRTRLAPLDSAGQPDLDCGLRRARAATLFTLALPGSAYIYQGEELGLPEVTSLPDDARQDPAWLRSGGVDGLRDGCRVPIPWSGRDPSYGFGPGTASWLPQPPEWAELSVAAEGGVDASTLEFYREAMRARRGEAALGDGPMEWLHVDDALLVFRRSAAAGRDLVCALNLSDVPARLPVGIGTDVLVASSDEIAAVSTDADEPRLVIGADTAVWTVN